MTNPNIVKTILVFTAHPDDHICAAGTLMLFAEHGFAIHEIVATGGEKGTKLDANGERSIIVDRSELAAERKQEIRRATKIIGINSVTFLGLPDSEVKRSYPLIEHLMQVIRRERPSLAFTMSQHDEHHDHKAVSNIVVEAAIRAAWSGWPELGGPFRIPVLLGMEGMCHIVPDVTVDITPYLERKQQAAMAYTSQVGTEELALLSTMNAYHGFFRRESEVKAAEAFEVFPHFPINLNALVNISGSTAPLYQ